MAAPERGPDDDAGDGWFDGSPLLRALPWAREEPGPGPDPVDEEPGWGLDPARWPGEVAEPLLVAAFREANRAAWYRSLALLHACRSSAGTLERDPGRHRAGKIAAAALGWSEAHGSGRLEFAHQILERLPRLGEEMAAGRLEERKAESFTRILADLDDAQAREVLDRLLDGAPRWSFQELEERIERTAAAIDPDWSRARYEAALARRRVVLRASPAGAADLCGYDLPPDLALDAYHRVEAIAAAVIAGLEALGRPAPRGPITAQVLCRIVGPEAVGYSDEAIAEMVIAEFLDGDPALAHTDVPDLPDPGDPGPGGGSGPDGGGPGPGGGSGPDGGGSGPDGGGPGPDDRGPHDSGPDDSGPADHGPDDAGPDSAGPDSPDSPDSPDGSSSPDASGLTTPPPEGPPGPPRPEPGPGPGDASDPSGGAPEPSPWDTVPGEPPTDGDGSGTVVSGAGGEPGVLAFGAGTVVRLGLATVLGLDRTPGAVPGGGMLPWSVARAMAWARSSGPWRLLVYDADTGALVEALPVRPPPLDLRSRPSEGAARRRARQGVELTVTTGLLDALDRDAAAYQAAGAAPAVANEAALAARLPTRSVVGTAAGALLGRARQALATARARPADAHPAVSTADAHRRLPGAALRRWVTARDQTCRGIGCSTDAVTCDIDHTLSWEDDGESVADDLGAFCRSDHLFKHDPTTGWRVTQTAPGEFTWTDPNHVDHVRRPEPHDPLPDERPPADGGLSIPAEALLPPIQHPTPPGAARPTATAASPRRPAPSPTTLTAADATTRVDTHHLTTTSHRSEPFGVPGQAEDGVCGVRPAAV